MEIDGDPGRIVADRPRYALRSSTQLQVACFDGHIDVIELLIKHGAYIDEEAEYYTALQLAVINGALDVVLLLLQNGADVNAPCGPCGQGTAIELAARLGYYDLTRI